VLRSTWLLGALVFIFTWPIPLATLSPQPGLDNSFVAGLHMAAYQGLHFGTQIVATYGPLGFLRYPALYYRWTVRLSLLYAGVVDLALCLTLVWSLRRILAPLAAAVMAYVAASLILATGAEPLPVIAFVWSVEYVRASGDRAPGRWFPIAFGALAGFACLTKINTGVTVGLIALLAILLAPRRSRRQLAAFAGAFVLSFAVLWFASGQTLSNLGPYLSTSREIVSGWSSVMMLYVPNTQWELAAAGLVAILIAALALHAAGDRDRRMRFALVLLWLVLAFSLFKEGFVRQESGHVSEFFAIALGATFAFTWRELRDHNPWLLTFLTVAVCWFGATAYNPTSLIHPGSSVSDLANDVSLSFSAGQIDADVASARQTLVSGYNLAPAVHDLLDNETVAIVPSEVSVAWAYRLRWVPLPVFELYYAYTSGLDALNAGLLSSDHAPARLLRGLQGSVDYREPVFDSPAAQRAMLCHYRELAVSGSWEVLGRIANRCGPARLLGVVRASWEQQVPVPAPSSPRDLVFVRIHGVGPAGLEAFATLLYRAELRLITPVVPGVPATAYRLVPGTASDGLLLTVPASSDYSRRFALGQGIRAVALSINGGSKARGLVYDFYEQPIAASVPS